MYTQRRLTRPVGEIKAIRWRYHQRGEYPKSAGWTVADALTGRQIEQLYRQSRQHGRQDVRETFRIPNQYGTGFDQNESRTDTRYPSATGQHIQTRILAYEPDRADVPTELALDNKKPDHVVGLKALNSLSGSRDARSACRSGSRTS